ncbi:MAG: hypothetical protein IH830_00320 [Planctomycetes bacterium]|nr:hypothetical protein [Planctomycetota bacterium]
MADIYCDNALLGGATDVDTAVHGTLVIQGSVVLLNKPQQYPSKFVKQYNMIDILNTATSGIQELAEKTEQTFTRLADEWEHDTAGSSLIQDMVDHPKYREIIALGRDALPFILERLSAQGGFWFGALHEISREFAPSKDDLGNREKMTAAWLEWGRENDLSG